MTEEELEQLKGQFIVDKTTYEKDRLPDLIKRVMNFCKVDNEGSIHIERPEMTIMEKVKLSLVARFVANQLDSKINSEVSVEELRNSIKVDKMVVVARMKDAVDTRFANRIDKGTYTVIPFKINSFLDELEKKYTNGGENK